MLDYILLLHALWPVHGHDSLARQEVLQDQLHFNLSLVHRGQRLRHMKQRRVVVVNNVELAGKEISNRITLQAVGMVLVDLLVELLLFSIIFGLFVKSAYNYVLVCFLFPEQRRLAFDFGELEARFMECLAYAHLLLK